VSRSVPWRPWAGAVLGLVALVWACWPAERGTRNWERGTDFGTGAYPARSAFRAPTSDFGKPAVAPPSADHRLDRPPSLSAAQIDALLASYDSPAARLGPVLYDLGVQSGIDPAYSLAFFVVESSCGTREVARTTHSLGNIRCTPGYACVDGYRAYSTWADGARDWFTLMRSLYLDSRQLRTPAPSAFRAPRSAFGRPHCLRR